MEEKRERIIRAYNIIQYYVSKPRSNSLTTVEKQTLTRRLLLENRFVRSNSNSMRNNNIVWKKKGRGLFALIILFSIMCSNYVSKPRSNSLTTVEKQTLITWTVIIFCRYRQNCDQRRLIFFLTIFKAIFPIFYYFKYFLTENTFVRSNDCVKEKKKGRRIIHAYNIILCIILFEFAYDSRKANFNTSISWKYLETPY